MKKTIDIKPGLYKMLKQYMIDYGIKKESDAINDALRYFFTSFVPKSMKRRVQHINVDRLLEELDADPE